MPAKKRQSDTAELQEQLQQALERVSQSELKIGELQVEQSQADLKIAELQDANSKLQELIEAKIKSLEKNNDELLSAVADGCSFRADLKSLQQSMTLNLSSTQANQDQIATLTDRLDNLSTELVTATEGQAKIKQDVADLYTEQKVVAKRRSSVAELAAEMASSTKSSQEEPSSDADSIAKEIAKLIDGDSKLPQAKKLFSHMMKRFSADSA
jgi:chromosome segregation ATPase